MARLKHPQYSLDTVRLSSYSRWPLDYQNPVILTDAGFFYAGYGDCVRCFSCGGGLRNWEYDDTPWIEHARWYPNCEYLKQRKGELFIEMHRQDKNEDEETFATIPPPSPTPSPSAPRRQTIHEAKKHEMEKALVNAANADKEDDISMRSVLEMGYSQSDVDFAVEQLRKQGKTQYSAADLMEIILDKEEKQTTTTSTHTITNTLAFFPTRFEASLIHVSADSESLLKENETLKHQMLCKICLDNDACVVYLPCGHMVTCQECAPTIRKCCICREMIHGTVKAYL